MKNRVLFSDVTFKAANLEEESSYRELASIADIMYKIPSTEDEMCELVKDVEAVIVGDFPVTPRVFDSATKLKLVAKCGVGYDNIQVDYATKRKVLVTNVPSVLSGPVAEHTMLLMLAVAKKLVAADSSVRTNSWGSFHSQEPGFELSGKTLGVIGFGARFPTRRGRAQCLQHEYPSLRSSCISRENPKVLGKTRNPGSTTRECRHCFCTCSSEPCDERSFGREGI